MQTPPTSRCTASLRSLRYLRPQRLAALRRVFQRDDLKALEAHLDADEIAVFTPLMDRACEPPLTAAVREGCSVPLLKALLRRGATVSEAGARGFTALHWVAMGACMARELFKDELEGPSPPRPPWDRLVSDLPPVSWAEAARGPVSWGMRSAPISEERQLALAACLLLFGAQASSEDGNGLTAADHADRNGRVRLALLIRHWSDLQVSHWLRMVATRTYAPIGCQRPSLSTMPPEVCGLVCNFLELDFVLPTNSRVRNA